MSRLISLDNLIGLLFLVIFFRFIFGSIFFMINTIKSCFLAMIPSINLNKKKVNNNNQQIIKAKYRYDNYRKRDLNIINNNNNNNLNKFINEIK